MLICASCDRENPRGARFCLGCGTLLAPAAAAGGNGTAEHETGEPGSRLPTPVPGNAPAGRAPGSGAPPGALPGAPIDGGRCPRCATVNPTGMNFCRNCGSGLEALGVAARGTPPVRAPGIESGAGPRAAAPAAAPVSSAVATPVPGRPASPAEEPAGAGARAGGPGSGSVTEAARPPRRTCPHCQTKTPTGYAFCQHCGKNLPSVSEAVRTGALISGETGGEGQDGAPGAAPLRPARTGPRPTDAPELTPVPVPRPGAPAPPSGAAPGAAIETTSRRPGARTPTPPSGAPVAVRGPVTPPAGAPRPAVPARKLPGAPTPEATPFPLAEDASAAPPARAPRPAGDPAWGTLILVNPDGNDGASFPLAGEWVDIGRARGDICFSEDRFLASPHLRLARAGEAARATPLDTLNGVFRRVKDPVEIEHGDVLLVGQELLRFELVDEDEREAPPLVRHGVALLGSPAREPWGRLMHLLASGGVSDVRHLYEPVVTIGREEGALVFPDDAFLSRRHASLSWNDDRCMVDDLGSSNGTFVRLAGPTEIRAGDTLRIGDHLIRLELG